MENVNGFVYNNKMIKTKTYFKEFFSVIGKINISMLAAQISFFLLLAFFPFCILLLLLLGRVHIDNSIFLNTISSFLPTQVVPMFSDIIENAGENMNIFWSLAGIISTLWVSSRAAHAMIVAVNRFYKKEDRWAWTHRMGLAVALTFALMIFIVVSILFVLFGREAMNTFLAYIGQNPENMSAFWGILRVILALLGLTLFFSVLFTISTKSKIHIKEALPGAIFSAVLWFLLTYVFSLIITNFFIFENIYGSLGSIILMMMWLYWGAHIILIGVAINKTTQNLKQ